MANSKFKKVIALIVTASMAASLAACSSVSAKKLTNIASKDLEAEEVDIDDIEDLEDDEMEDGVYFTATGEDLENFIDDIEEKSDNALSEMSSFGFDFDDFDTDEVKQASGYIMSDGDEDDQDLRMIGAIVMEMNEKKDAADMFDTYLETFEDNFEIDFDELSKDEYKLGKSDGYFLMNLDADTIIDIYGDMILNVYSEFSSEVEEDTIKDLIKEQKKQFADQFGDMRIVYGVYFNGNVVTSIVGISYSDDLDEITTIAKGLGLNDPTKVENSDELIDGLGHVDSSFLKNLA